MAFAPNSYKRHKKRTKKAVEVATPQQPTSHDTPSAPKRSKHEIAPERPEELLPRLLVFPDEKAPAPCKFNPIHPDAWFTLPGRLSVVPASTDASQSVYFHEKTTGHVYSPAMAEDPPIELKVAHVGLPKLPRKTVQDALSWVVGALHDIGFKDPATWNDATSIRPSSTTFELSDKAKGFIAGLCRTAPFDGIWG